MTTPTTLSKGTTVYHITREFGPASVNSIGDTVTALARAQRKSGLVNARIVMPYYSFLKKKYDIEKVTDLIIDVRDSKQRPVPIEFRVWRMNYVFSPPPAPAPANGTVWEIVNGVNTTSVDDIEPEPKPVPPTEWIPVYLIGPGNRRPFSQAFRAKNAQSIHTTVPAGLPQEWKDQFFCKAAAAFLMHQATAVDEESLFAPIRRAPHIDVVHIHGASNAYIAKYLHDKLLAEQLGPKPPGVIYTMHDYMDELQYTNTIKNVHKFTDEPNLAVMKPYASGNRISMSRLGIDHASVTTVVGRNMASDIVEGRAQVFLKETVMESILTMAQKQRFFGISNGLDLGKVDPFTDEKLTTRKLAYPQYALDLVQNQLPLAEGGGAATTASRTSWALAATPNDYVTTSKDRAKRFLNRRNLLMEQDLKRPLALYMGDISRHMDILEQAAKHFSSLGVKFVIIGRPGDIPLEKLEAFEQRYPGDLIVLPTPKQERQWGIFCRSAADFVFVPDMAENTGMFAAEGLWFGSSVIASGTGDIADHLIDRPASAAEADAQRQVRIVRDKQTRAPTVTTNERHNAYLYGTMNTLEDAIQDAYSDYQRINVCKALREEYVLRMIRSSMTLLWDRDNQHTGPLHDYRRVYEIALADRTLPALNRHEIEEEEALLQRLRPQLQHSDS